ncbi:MAG: AMP-binding protein [Alphaproteobacteria bacterium]|nr:MAG: AMP-binding protein [Alphaproteobacteria bacterium]
MNNSNNVAAPLSYACGPTTEPLSYETIGNAFDRIAATFPDRPAVIARHQNIRWTYAEFKREVDAFAAGLVALGLEPGDRIGMWAPNRIEWVVTQYASAKAGLILVNINPAYRPQELAYCLKKVGCKALVTAAHFKTSDYIAMLNELIPELADSEPGALKSKAFPELTTLIRLGDEATDGFFLFSQIADRGDAASVALLAELANVLQPDDPINIQFTSGTTGAPKGATLTHFNILNNARFCGQTTGLNEHDVFICPLPLYHCAGMVCVSMASMTAGAAVVYPDEAFDPASVLQAVDEEKATILGGVPTMFLSMLDHPEFASFDVSSLRSGVIGGAPCPVELMKRIIADLHIPDITIIYGMTETSPVSFQTAANDTIERRVGTVGQVHPHVEVRVVDTEGRTVPCGQQGEVLTRGYLVMYGYWADEKRTQESIDASGWMHTGDLGVLDEHGYLKITGRAKDMVIRGGENIYPREIEEFLYTHPDIQEVQVFGVPDDKFGEELCAWVQLREGVLLDEEEIRVFCRGELAHYKIPRYISFVNEFPMTVTGKIQKFAMREIMVKQLQNP